MAAGGVARSEGERLDPLARIENVREREQNPHGMKGYVDLTSDVLDEQRTGKQIVRDRLTRQEVRDLTSRLLVQLCLNRGDRPREARFTGEGSEPRRRPLEGPPRPSEGCRTPDRGVALQ